MRNLKEYMRESLDKHIRESLDTENIFYKIDQYYRDNTDDRAKFISIVQKCKGDKPLDDAKIQKYVDYEGIDVKKFTEFCHDCIKGMDGTEPVDQDIMHLFKGIIQMVLNDRSESNTIWKEIQ